MRIADRIIARCMKRAPDEEIRNGAGEVYMQRWHIVRIYRVLNVYVHRFMLDDDDRALHDHPWHSLSWMMRGQLREITFNEYTMDVLHNDVIEEGDWTFRSDKFAHRLTVPTARRGKVWTLFITGPKTREWGFWCAQGWMHWTKFHADGNGCAK